MFVSGRILDEFCFLPSEIELGTSILVAIIEGKGASDFIALSLSKQPKS